MDIEKANVFKKYSGKVGEIFSGEVYQTWKNEVLILDEDGNELRMPKSEQIPGERFKKNDTIRAIIKSVEMKNNTTPYIVLSRTTDSFLEKLPASWASSASSATRTSTSSSGPRTPS